MKPVEKTVYVWDCGNENHYHKKEITATRCMEKTAKEKRYSATKEMIHTRNIMIARDVVNGATFEEAGRAIGLTAARIGQIAKKIFRQSWAISAPTDPPCHCHDIVDVRKHKSYWMKQIDKVAAHWGV